MMTWGFLQTYIRAQPVPGLLAASVAGGTLIGALLLWDILFRGQLGFSVSFLEEMWARNHRQSADEPVAADRIRRSR